MWWPNQTYVYVRRRKSRVRQPINLYSKRKLTSWVQRPIQPYSYVLERKLTRWVWHLIHLILDYGDEVTGRLVTKSSFVWRKRSFERASCEVEEERYQLGELWSTEYNQSFEVSDWGISLGTPESFWNSTSINKRIWMDN